MLKVLSCLTTDHDWRLVLVAAVVCVVSAVTAFEIWPRALKSRGPARLGWFGLSGFSAGSGVWGTHFIAMIAYQPGLRTGYEAAGVLLSLFLAVAGTALAFWIASRTRGRVRPLAGGVALGAAVGAMHYTGMAAFKTQGTLSWDAGLVAGSVFVVLLMAAAAFAVARDASTLGRRAAGAAGMVASICGLHFTGMSAVTIAPDPTITPPPALLSSGAMTMALVVLVALVMLTAAGVLVVEARSKGSALERLKEAIEAMPGGFAMFDAEDRLQVWNSRYAELGGDAGSLLNPGVRLVDLLKRELELGLYPDAQGREAAWLEARLAERRTPRGAFEQRCGDRWLRLDERRAADGGTICVAMDVTDLKRDAEALATARDQAEAASRAKSEFLTNMSHEVRTPLNGVLGLAGALARTDLTPEQRDMVRTIETSAAALARLMGDVLDLSRIEAGRLALRPEPFDLGETAQDAAALYRRAAQEKGLVLEVRAPANVRAVGDTLRLRQILLNLLDNAVKFTEAGSVALAVEQTGAGAWRFEVRDTGPGFGPEMKARLFERFTQADGSLTRRHGGSGLGLAVAAELAGAMGGTLSADSKPGEGSTFVLELPLAPAAEEALSAPPAEPAPAEPRRARILLAEDNPTNRKVVEVMLSGLEVELVAAADGAEAVRAFESEAFDAVLMDMQMPEMDGLDATRAIRARERELGLPRTPVLMLSANAMPEHLEASRQAGADRHLAKPIRLADLLAAVSEALAGKSERLAA